jgi:hypothetical protein
MNKPSLSDRKSKLRLIDCSQHDRLDRSALPPKFSYPNKPITMTVPLFLTKCSSTWAELLGDAIRQYTELAGIVPFDWEEISPVPKGWQSGMRRSDDKFYLVHLGFDTKEQALEAKAKFTAIKREDIDIWTEEEVREDMRRCFEGIEKGSDDRIVLDGGNGREIYWRDHPLFQEGWRDYIQHAGSAKNQRVRLKVAHHSEMKAPAVPS